MPPSASQGQVSASYDVLAPDGSEIRLAGELTRGSMVECTLPAGAVSQAGRHRTVEELWLVIAGQGEIWRKQGDDNTDGYITRIEPGTWLTIARRTQFQFRATSNVPLRIVIATMPPWPGPDEAVPCLGIWSVG